MYHKLYIHNVKEWKVSGLTLKFKNGNFYATIKGVTAIIPLEKFENKKHKMIQNMYGSISYMKNRFKIHKKKASEWNSIVEVRDSEGNTATREIETVHYNSTEHVQLIQHLKRKETFFVISAKEGKEISLGIYSEENFEKDIDNRNFFYLEFKDKETFKEIIDYYKENTEGLFYVYNVEAIEKITSIKINRYIDYKEQVDMDKAYEDSIIPVNNLSRAFFIGVFAFQEYKNGTSEDLQLLIKQEKDSEETEINRPVSLKNGLIDPKEFIEHNEQGIVDYVEKELSGYSPFDIESLFWILMQGIKYENEYVVKKVVEGYISREEDNNYLDYSFLLIYYIFLFNKYEFLEDIIKIYKRYNEKGFLKITNDRMQKRNDMIYVDYIHTILGVENNKEITIEKLKGHPFFENIKEEVLEDLVSLI